MELSVSRVKKAEAGGGQFVYIIGCPGCGMHHSLTEEWGFNGDFEKPTFTPSLHCSWPTGYGDDPTPKICHSFIRDGQIQYLGDCTHDLAGQTVELPDLKKWRDGFFGPDYFEE